MLGRSAGFEQISAPEVILRDVQSLRILCASAHQPHMRFRLDASQAQYDASDESQIYRRLLRSSQGLSGVSADRDPTSPPLGNWMVVLIPQSSSSTS